MSEKINLQDLSALLAEKASITKKDAETFLREYFDVMHEALFEDKLFKIKELGTFKLSLMEDRESVDVTTGERVLIPAHYKATFAPDKKLAEAINEPFALFETTEIEDESIVENLRFIAKNEPVDEEETIETRFEKADNENDEMNVESGEADIENDETDTASIETDVEKIEENVESIGEDEDEDKEEEPALENHQNIYYIKNRSCLGCHDREAHHNYRKKYYSSRKKLRLFYGISFALFLFLAAAVGYIVFFELENQTYYASHPVIVMVPQSTPAEDTIPEISSSVTERVLPVNDSIKVPKTIPAKDTIPEISPSVTERVLPVNDSIKKNTGTTTVPPQASGSFKQITMAQGDRLTTVAQKEYGDKVFWIYIYLENKELIKDPNQVPVGVKLSIPPASKYGIDKDDPASVQKARNKMRELL